jgi:hypothetical protein
MKVNKQKFRLKQGISCSEGKVDHGEKRPKKSGEEAGSCEEQNEASLEQI